MDLCNIVLNLTAKNGSIYATVQQQHQVNKTQIKLFKHYIARLTKMHNNIP